MTGRKLIFHDSDEYGDSERAALIAFVAANPFQIIAPLRWRCEVPGQDRFEVWDTGGCYVVKQYPFLGSPLPIARIANVGHQDDGWIRAVRAVMHHAETRQQRAATKGRR